MSFIISPRSLYLSTMFDRSVAANNFDYANGRSIFKKKRNAKSRVKAKISAIRSRFEADVAINMRLSPDL